MKSLKYILTLMVMVFLTTSLNAEGIENVTESSSGYSFPSSKSIGTDAENYTISLTGLAPRKKFWMCIYAVASYSESPVSSKDKNEVIESILDPSRAKELVFVKSLHLTSSKIQNGYRDALKNILSKEEYKELEPEIEELCSLHYDSADSGDENILRWLPGSGLEVEVKGELRGLIQNQDLMQAIWKIWLGEKSCVNKDSMIKFFTL